jgi:glycosyltransferase involved in cell wall biosynthesis
LVRLENLPTIAAIGPFDDREYAQQLAAAFIAVRQHCTAQLLVVGAGVQRISVARTAFAQGLGNSVHSVMGNSCDDWWSNLVAAADVVVLNSAANVTTLLDVLDVGRPVVAPADPATTQLLVPAIAGLVYQPGDVSEMTGALLRLLSTPVLRRGMGGRAKHVARRHHLENGMRNKSEEGRRI